MMSLELRAFLLVVACVFALIQTGREKSFGWGAFALVLGMQAYDVFQLSLDT